VFDEVAKNEGGRRAVRRGAWVAGSLAVQAGLAIALALLSTAPPAKVKREPVVDVKFVKGAAMPASPPALPPPMTPPRERPRHLARPVRPMIQPKEVPKELQPPAPEELPEPEAADPDDQDGNAVVGGAVGGVVGLPAPSPRQEFDEATMKRPVFVSGPDPGYTRKALEREVEGLMIVKCVVTLEGRVQDCRVLKSLPFMDSAVVSALERKRYKPATLNGTPIEVDYVFRLNFRLPR
jgi:periplasmic protein TonB